jgi:hypothetical protein
MNQMVCFARLIRLVAWLWMGTHLPWFHRESDCVRSGREWVNTTSHRVREAEWRVTDVEREHRDKVAELQVCEVPSGHWQPFSCDVWHGLAVLSLSIHVSFTRHCPSLSARALRVTTSWQIAVRSLEEELIKERAMRHESDRARKKVCLRRCGGVMASPYTKHPRFLFQQDRVCGCFCMVRVCIVGRWRST